MAHADFTVQEGATQQAALKLAPGKGNLRVNLPSDAAGQDCYLDGQKLSSFSGYLEGIVAGSHRFEIRGDYLSCDMSVDVALSATSEIDAAIRRYGDLTIISDPQGAQLVVNGTKVGISPYTMKRLESGTRVGVDARSGNLVAHSDYTVQNGRTQQVSLRLSLGKGDLRVHLPSDAAGLDCYLDGNKLSGFTGSIAGVLAGSHRFEIRSQYLSCDMAVDVSVGGTAAVDATVKRFGALVASLPGQLRDATFSVDGMVVSGSRAFLEVGTHELTLVHPKIRPISERVDIQFQKEARWSPKPTYRTGTLVVSQLPPMATVAVDGIASTKSSGAGLIFENCVIGEHTVSFSAPYVLQRASLTLSIAEGENKSLKSPSGAFSFDTLPEGVPVSIVAEGGEFPLTMSGDSGGATLSPALLPGHYKLRVKGRYLNLVSLDLTISDGQTSRLGAIYERGAAKVDASSDKIAAYLRLRDGTETSLGSQPMLLDPGIYKVTMWGPGKAPKASGVDYSLAVFAGKTSTVPLSLAERRMIADSRFSSRKKYLSIGWVGVSTMVIGVLGAGASYYLGTQAMSEYRNAQTSAASATARQKADTLGVLTYASAGVAGAGLLLGPPILLFGPRPSALKAGLDELDRQIRDFKEIAR